jgi:nucleoside-diphosphate-sugar epimerase
MHVVSLLEEELGRTAVKEMLPMQPGDVPATYADIEDLVRDVGFKPTKPRLKTALDEMVSRVPQGLTNYLTFGYWPK